MRQRLRWAVLLLSVLVGCASDDDSAADEGGAGGPGRGGAQGAGGGGGADNGVPGGADGGSSGSGGSHGRGGEGGVGGGGSEGAGGAADGDDLPILRGVARVGETLAGYPSAAGASGTPSYAWLRCAAGGGGCVAIPGAATARYRVVAADLGATLRVRVTTARGPAESSPTAPVVAARSGDVSGTNYYVAKMFDGAPLNEWPGVWANAKDGALWAAFTSATGTPHDPSDTPQWVITRYGPYAGAWGFVAKTDQTFDAWDLTSTTRYMKSTDAGKSWSLEAPLGAGSLRDMIGPDASGAPGAASECASSASGAGCRAPFESAYSPQPTYSLADGTLLRRVNGEDIFSDFAVKPTAFIQRLAPGATQWSGVVYLEPPAEATAQISRIRPLADGRLLGVGQLWPAPAGQRLQQKTPALHMLWVSGDQGASWQRALTLAPSLAEDAVTVDEWDVAELPDGDLIAVMRGSVTSGAGAYRYQTLLTRLGAGWQITEAPVRTPFNHSGHPELVATKEGPIVYVATDDTSGVAAPGGKGTDPVHKGIWFIADADAESAPGLDQWRALPIAANAYTKIFANAGAGAEGGCVTAGSAAQCSSFYYPRAIETEGGKIVIVSFSGRDSPYPPNPSEVVYVQSFDLDAP